jgi:hypothetical protein
VAQAELAEKALEKVSYEVTMRVKAKRLAEEKGELEQAMAALSKALSPTHSKLKRKSKKGHDDDDDEDDEDDDEDDEDDDDEEEEDDDDDENEEIGDSKDTLDKSKLLPAHLKVDLLLLRYVHWTQIFQNKIK